MNDGHRSEDGLATAAMRPPGVFPVLVLVFALGVPLALLFSQTPRGDHSSGDQGPDGTAALAGVLERMSLPVERMGVGLLPLRFEKPGSVLFMPLAESGRIAASLSSNESEMLRRFVEAGSSLVLLTNRQSEAADTMGFDVMLEGRPQKKVRERNPEGELAPATFLRPESLGGPLRVEGEAWLLPQSADEVLYGHDGFPVAAQRSVGLGRVLLVTDPTTISNRGLSRGGNLEFYVGFVQRWLGPDGRVLFDEVHAGGGSERGGVAYARRAGLLPMLLLIGLLTILYIWRGSTRFGVVQSDDRALLARSSGERIRATAGLYDRAGLYHHGLVLSSRRFRRLLEARSGRSWNKDQLRAWVEREWDEAAGLHFDRIHKNMRLLLGQERPDPKSCLNAVRAIHKFEDSYLQRRAPSVRDQ